MAFLVTGAIIAGGIAVAGGAAKLGMSLAGRRGRINEQRAAKAEFDKMKGEYENLDTSNLAAGFKNPYAIDNYLLDFKVLSQRFEISLVTTNYLLNENFKKKYEDLRINNYIESINYIPYFSENNS